MEARPVIYISHRANINGPNPKWENHPDYIQKALDAGYNVEVDVRYLQGNWFFGHDEPQWRVTPSFLNEGRLWLHCKNVCALQELIKIKPTANYFWHQEDDYTITSNGLIWVHPKAEMPCWGGIMVLPEKRGDDWLIDAHVVEGFCSDYIETYMKSWEQF